MSKENVLDIEIESLKKDLKKLQKKDTELRSKIRNLEDEKYLPEFKKKYKGKYFTFHNSFGSNERSWKVYVRVDEIKSPREIIGTTFQKDLYNEIKIVKGVIYDYLFEKQISREKFYKAWDAIQKELNEAFD